MRGACAFTSVCSRALEADLAPPPAACATTLPTRNVEITSSTRFCGKLLRQDDPDGSFFSSSRACVCNSRRIRPVFAFRKCHHFDSSFSRGSRRMPGPFGSTKPGLHDLLCTSCCSSPQIPNAEYRLLCARARFPFLRGLVNVRVLVFGTLRLDPARPWSGRLTRLYTTAIDPP